VNNYPLVLSIVPLSNPQMHGLIDLQKRQKIYIGVNHKRKVNHKKGEEKKEKIHFFGIVAYLQIQEDWKN
jgi:hypothetical protein